MNFEEETHISIKNLYESQVRWGESRLVMLSWLSRVEKMLNQNTKYSYNKRVKLSEERKKIKYWLLTNNVLPIEGIPEFPTKIMF